MRFFLAFLAIAAVVEADEGSGWRGPLGWSASEVNAARAAHLAEVARIREAHLGVLNAALARNQGAQSILTTPIAASRRIWSSGEVEAARGVYVDDVSPIPGQRRGTVSVSLSRRNLGAPAIFRKSFATGRRVWSSNEIEAPRGIFLEEVHPIPGQRLGTISASLARRTQAAPGVDTADPAVPTLAGFPIGRQPNLDHDGVTPARRAQLAEHARQTNALDAVTLANARNNPFGLVIAGRAW